MKKLTILLALPLLCAACQTVESQQQAQLDVVDENPDGKKKQSLDQLLDEHDKVTLLDDDTGEEKLICKRIRPEPGTRIGARKLCATKKQWADSKQQSQDEINSFQRKMTLGGKSN